MTVDRRRRAIAILVLGGVLTAAVAPVAQGALPLRHKNCGAVVMNSFRLKNNLNCGGDGLKIGRSGITIDLNGKRIKGDGGPKDWGIANVAGRDDIVVRNGRIQGFDDGIHVGAGGRRNTFRNLIIGENAFDGIDFDGGRGHRVIGSIIAMNGQFGIQLVGRGRILGNLVASSGQDGIYVEGNGSRVLDNEAHGNTGAGIFVFGNDNDVIRNAATQNQGGGLILGGDGNAILGNEFCGNGGEEMSITGDGNTVDDNNVADTCPP
jgi:parallel beta-helix repeat protein